MNRRFDLNAIGRTTCLLANGALEGDDPDVSVVLIARDLMLSSMLLYSNRKQKWELKKICACAVQVMRGFTVAANDKCQDWVAVQCDVIKGIIYASSENGIPLESMSVEACRAALEVAEIIDGTQQGLITQYKEAAIEAAESIGRKLGTAVRTVLDEKFPPESNSPQAPLCA
ncbi:MAG: hypothetical protein JXA52_03770 [Planctomycetes bacterium]|nr:hypothetical protein [Planctomycetota bacterium]